jgi:hypothetical protein
LSTEKLLEEKIEGNCLTGNCERNQATDNARAQNHNRRPARNVNGVLAQHNTHRADAKCFVTIAAFFAANRTDKKKRQHGVFQNAFAARENLLEPVTAFTFVCREGHDPARKTSWQHDDTKSNRASNAI